MIKDQYQLRMYSGLLAIGPLIPNTYTKYSPTLWKDCWNVDDSEDDDEVIKDGPHLSKAKKYIALRLDKGQRDLSVYSNGRLLNQVVTTPVSQQASADLTKACMVSR